MRFKVKYDSRNMGICCMLLLMIIVFLSIAAPQLSPNEYDMILLSDKNVSPNSKYWFGTDSLGRDLWTRVWLGTRTTIIIAVLGAFLSQIIGCFIGSISGYFGGWIDLVIMSILDICTSIPSLIYITLLYLLLGPGIYSMIFAISISSWMETARFVRSRVLQYRGMDFILLAKLQGASSSYIIRAHILPNIIGYMVIRMFTAIPAAIFMEAYLSFIGMGVSSPNVSLGLLCQNGVSLYRIFPYQLIIPSTILMLVVLSFYSIGNILRSSIDFRL